MADNLLLIEALQRTTESDSVEFKSSFDPSSNADWLEVIKDIVAIANSGGGIILFGLNDDGCVSDSDVSMVADIDIADVGNKLHKYTGANFRDLEFAECTKDGKEIVAAVVGPSEIPIVFTKVGTYQVDAEKQKTAFSQGTVYFRHVGKSEPGNTEDLRLYVERRLNVIRKSWLDGIAKIVEAPAGSRIAVLPPATFGEEGGAILPFKLVDDPQAPPYYAVPIDKTHPYRQKELIQQLNAKLAGEYHVTAHQMLCVRRVYNIDSNINFCYTQNYASPRYSKAFVDWLVARYKENLHFFEQAKTTYDAKRTEVT